MKITNKRAFYDYQLLDRFEAGIKLNGGEVKAIREGHADLTGSFARLIGSEAYLVNAKIFPYKFMRTDEYDEKRTRKLLMHKKEILKIKAKLDGAGLTIVPVSLYNKHHLIKVELALGKGKKQFQKKESLKRKDIEREVQEELKRNRAR